MRMPNRIHHYKWYTYFLFLASIIYSLSFLEYSTTYSITLFQNIKSLIIYIYIIIGNSLFILSPYFLIPSRWRLLFLFPIWIIAILSVCFILYYKFFNAFMPFENLYTFNNLNSLLVDSAKSKITIQDLSIPILALIVSYLAVLLFRAQNTKQDSFGNRTKLLCFILSILPLFIYEINVLCQYKGTIYDRISARYSEKFYYERSISYRDGGMIPFLSRNIIADMKERYYPKKISLEEIAYINKYWETHDSLIASNDSINSIFRGNYNKNLIFIVVESLNSDVIESEILGKPVTPFLKRISNDNTIIVNKNMKSQVLSGMSSDGQFIYNTGLLPSSTATTAIKYSDNKFISLANILPHYSMEIICEEPTFWNHNKTNKSYGYDGYVYNISEIAQKKNVPTDHELFATTLQYATSIKQPFFIFATTITMHSPYKGAREKRPAWINNAKTSEERKNYYHVSNIFDRELQFFIDSLKLKDVYKNTIIIIASDHAGVVDDKHQEQPIYFAILNAGVGGEVKKPMHQIDVFPTILNVLGRYPTRYNGMGYSIFTPTFNTVDNDPLLSNFSPQLISNLMLRNNWFNSYYNK